MIKNYELTDGRIRDIAEGYAWLATLYHELNSECDLQKRTQIARKVIDEAIPFYRSVLPEDFVCPPRQQVNPSELEETCKKILEIN